MKSTQHLTFRIADILFYQSQEEQFLIMKNWLHKYILKIVILNMKIYSIIAIIFGFLGHM